MTGLLEALFLSLWMHCQTDTAEQVNTGAMNETDWMAMKVAAAEGEEKQWIN